MIVFILCVVTLSLSLALVNYLKVKNKESGTEDMERISKYIQDGAKEFLKQEYKILIIVSLIIALLISTFISISGAVSFLLGAGMSALAGWIGMKAATTANVKVANEARKTVKLGKTMKIAFQGGSVMGLSVASFALLGITLVYLIFGIGFKQLEQSHLVFKQNSFGIIDIPFVMSISCYALGCSLIAMFNRVGGGIYTKAADMGADLVGKSEVEIPEDDARNPATIADNVGDNVGDVAGLGSDLLESFIGAMISSIVLAIYTAYSRQDSSSAISYSALRLLIAYPIIFSGLGLLSSTLAIFLFSVKRKVGDPHKELNGTTYLSALLTIISTYVFTKLIFTEKIEMFRLGSASPWLCAVLGIVSGITIGMLAEYYTSYKYSPTLKVSKASNEGSAIVITEGMGLGMKSTLAPVMILAFCIILSKELAGLYGVGISAIGMLSFVAVTVSVDTYGPIADNAGGIAEMCHLSKGVRSITDKLDAVGNTTAAIGKGFAIGSAALAALSLFASYLYAVNAEESLGIVLNLNIIDNLTLSGALVGGALPFLFSGILIDAVSKTAGKMVDEVRKQFRDDPLILKGESIPNYKRCISISSKGALKEMKKPAMISVISPLLGGFIFGPRFVGGLLIGTTLSAIMLALYTANAGGSWDNAKKYIELGNNGGPNSPSHKASIVGDTVGDPLKDTVGPSLDILIKIMSVISIISVSIYSEYNLINMI